MVGWNVKIAVLLLVVNEHLVADIPLLVVLIPHEAKFVQQRNLSLGQFTYSAAPEKFKFEFSLG